MKSVVRLAGFSFKTNYCEDSSEQHKSFNKIITSPISPSQLNISELTIKQHQNTPTRFFTLRIKLRTTKEKPCRKVLKILKKKVSIL